MRTIQGIYLLLGSNLGDRGAQLQQARALLESSAGKIVRASAIYVSEAWGETQQPDFYNQVVEIATGLPAEALLQQTQVIEQQMGKVKIGKWRERLIDIDILYYRDQIMDTPKLQLPHPEIQNRNFVLIPMAALNAGEVHPVLLKTHPQMLEGSPDKLKVWKHLPESSSEDAVE